MIPNWLETELAPSASWELKGAISDYLALAQHPLYRPTVEMDPIEQTRLRQLTERLQDRFEASCRINDDIESKQEAQRDLEREAQGVVSRWLHPGRTRETPKALACLSQRMEELQRELAVVQDEKRQLEESIRQQFFNHIPLRIARPPAPNVFGVSTEGFEEGRREFRFFGERAKYMVTLNLHDYLSRLQPDTVLSVLQVELDAYSSEVQHLLENDADVASLVREMGYRYFLSHILNGDGDLTQSLENAVEASPSLRDGLHDMLRTHERRRQDNFEIFYEHMDAFLRRILPLPNGFGDDVMIYIDDKDPAGSHSTGLFAVLEEYFRTRRIIFDAELDTCLSVGDFVNVRIGEVTSRQHVTEKLLGVPVDCDVMNVRILGGCTFIGRSFYHRKDNYIFLEDATSSSVEVCPSPARYSPAKIRADTLLHEKGHVLFETIAGKHIEGSFKRAVLSEVFARLVTGCLGVCTLKHTEALASMRFGDAVYAAACDEIIAYVEPAADSLVEPSRPSYEGAAEQAESSTPCNCTADAEETDGETMETDRTDQTLAQLDETQQQRAYRMALASFCRRLSAEYAMDCRAILKCLESMES